MLQSLTAADAVLATNTGEQGGASPSPARPGGVPVPGDCADWPSPSGRIHQRSLWAWVPFAERVLAAGVISLAERGVQVLSS